MELKGIGNDMLGNILSHLEGTSLASVACTSSSLCELARDEVHWTRLCNSTWPSTELEPARRMISDLGSDGFARFYASCYPRIVYDDNAAANSPVGVYSSPDDLVSLVDVFLDDKCVLSKVLDGIPTGISDQKLEDREIGEKGSESWRWFLNCPFHWDSLDQDQINGDVIGESSSSEDQSEELIRCTLRLSWILLDKKSGRAANLSSWKPLFLQMNGPYDDNCVARFGCVLPVQQSLLPHKLAKCIITARFKTGPNCPFEGSLNWKELSLVIEDIEGARVNGEKSLKILNQAITGSRSINQLKVEEGLSRYEEEKSRAFERKEFGEKIAGRLFILIETAAFVTCCYTLRNLF